MYSAAKGKASQSLIKKRECRFHIIWQRWTLITASHLSINVTKSVTSITFYCRPTLSISPSLFPPWEKMHCLHIYSVFLFPPNARPPVGLRAGALWPPPWLRFLPHRREWHDIYQSCEAVIHFFFFFWNGTAGIYTAERTHTGPLWDSFVLAC